MFDEIYQISINIKEAMIINWQQGGSKKITIKDNLLVIEENIEKALERADRKDKVGNNMEKLQKPAEVDRIMKLSNWV